MAIAKFTAPAIEKGTVPQSHSKKLSEKASRSESSDKAHSLQMYYLVRISQLCALLAISRSTVYGRMSPGSNQFDPNFPRPVKLGPRSIGWRLSDVLDYVNTLQSE